MKTTISDNEESDDLPKSGVSLKDLINPIRLYHLYVELTNDTDLINYDVESLFDWDENNPDDRCWK